MDISTKCKFLAEHGFEIFDEKKNKELREFRNRRNDIAHYNFLIEENGKIKVNCKKNHKWQEIDLLSLHGELMDITTEILFTIWQRVIFYLK